MTCIVCKHAFSWRIGPLERVCSQCGALHTLKSGIWELAPHAKADDLPIVPAHVARMNGSRARLMKIVSDFDLPMERRARS